jgi:transposase
LTAAERDRDDVRVRREAWRKDRVNWDPAHLVFLDETGLTTAMVRRHGWGPRGKRVVGPAPQGHWHTTPFGAALRPTGLTAPLVTEGPMTGELFLAYVREFLAPTLSPGDRVICDHLSSPLGAGVGDAIEARGAMFLPLPPYSPDLNPIEQMFAKRKAALRKAAPRTLEALHAAVAEALEHFPPAECAHSLRGAGYALQAR